MEKIITDRTSIVLDFAAQELSDYYRKVTGVNIEQNRYGIYRLVVDSTLNEIYDEYAIRIEKTEIVIAGANDRAVLYGVYAFCDRILGVKFIRPDYEWIPSRKEEGLTLYSFGKKAAFRIRAYTPDTPDSFDAPIDALVKLGYNAYSISAANWEKHKATMKQAMEKRGMMLSISGHDISFFVPPEKYFSVYPEWFSLYDGKRDARQMCYSNEKFASELSRSVAQYCRKEHVHELVIMFNDNAYKCTCEKCRKTDFMTGYLNTLKQVGRELERQNLSVRLYNIAYNAALAWDMLENIPAEARGNCIIACWGRDYRYSLSEPKDALSERFHDTFVRWGKHLTMENASYAVFEYYGDHWMMSSLLPPMGKVIRKDIAFMNTVHVNRIDVLNFGFRGAIRTFNEIIADCGYAKDKQHWELDTQPQITWFNFFAAGRHMWDLGLSDEQVLREYTEACFGDAAPAAAYFYAKAEDALAPLSRFSTDMFKLRITDAWYRDDFSLVGNGRIHVHRWQPEDSGTEITCRAAQICERAYLLLGEALEVLRTAVTGIQSPVTAQEKNTHELFACAEFLLRKTKSLACQYHAQIALTNKDLPTAEKMLDEALLLEKGFDGTATEECSYWLHFCHRG